MIQTGRNLILQTNQDTSTVANWSSSNNVRNTDYTVTPDVYEGHIALKFKRLTTCQGWSMCVPKGNNVVVNGIVPGHPYTISFDIKSNNAGIGYQLSIMKSNAKDKLLNFNNGQQFRIPANEWTHVSFTAVALDAPKSDQIFYLYPSPGSAGLEVSLCNIKLEYGDHETPWSPAPEDSLNVAGGGH